MRERRLEPHEREDHPGVRPPLPAPALGSARVLAMQRGVGNAMVARALVARQAAPAQQAPAPEVLPDLDPDAHPSTFDVELLQQKLNWHLGFMRRTLLVIDGDFGPRTRAAVKVFKRARGLTPPDAKVVAGTWTALAATPAAPPAKEAPGGPSPDYDRMLEDGLLDVTIAHGFDEGGIQVTEVPQIITGLTRVRGFARDSDRADVLRRAAGRPPISGRGDWFVKENYATSGGRPVHAVIKLVTPEPEFLGLGADVAKAATTGMNESDAFMYTGHARYGTGPDFDRNYRFRVDWSKYDATVPAGHTGIEDYDSVSKLITDLALTGGDAAKIARFERLRTSGALEFIPMPSGNIPINPGPMAHQHEFTAYLMRLSVAGQPTGLEGAVTDESRYRLWLFNGCSTANYTKAIRSAKKPQFGKQNLDMHVTNDSIPARESAEEILTYLDGVMAQESASALTARLKRVDGDDAYSADF